MNGKSVTNERPICPIPIRGGPAENGVTVLDSLTTLFSNQKSPIHPSSTPVDAAIRLCVH